MFDWLHVSSLMIGLDEQIGSESRTALIEFGEYIRRGQEWVLNSIINIIAAIIVWIIAKKLIKLIVKVIEKMLDKNDVNVEIKHFAVSFVKGIWFVSVVFLIVEMLGISTTSLLAVIGSAAVGIGLSLQGSLSNFAGGLMILFFKPFVAGDYISTDTYHGKVVSMDMLYTKLLTVDNRLICIPNGTLSNSSIINLSSQGVRRMDIPVAISYSTDVRKVREVMEEFFKEDDRILQNYNNSVVVRSLDDSSLDVCVRVWLKSEDYWDVEFLYPELVKRKLDEAGIEIPFNQLDVHIKQD